MGCKIEDLGQTINDLRGDLKLKEMELNNQRVNLEEKYERNIENLERKCEVINEEKLMLRGEMIEKEKILTC